MSVRMGEHGLRADDEAGEPGSLSDAGGTAKLAGQPSDAARSALVYASLVLLAVDVVMVVLGFLTGYYLRFISGLFPFDEYQPLRGHLGSLVLQVVMTSLVLGANGRYRPSRSVSWFDLVYSLLADISVATALSIVVGAFLWRDGPFSRLMMALVWISIVSYVVFGRVVTHRLAALARRRGAGEERVLIVGTGDPARLVLERIHRSPEMGYRVVGFAAEDGGALDPVGFNVLGSIDDIRSVVKANRVDTVIVAVPTLPSQRMLDILGLCNAERISMKVYPDLFQLMTSGVNIGDLNGLPLVSVKDVALRGWNLAVKRALDVAVSATLLVLLSPLFLLLAAIVKLTSPGGALYCQERVGLDGQPFQVIKFRTMRTDAESETGPVWAQENDPRRTRIGTFLRHTSLDELPQLINVLLGDMSLVGPRPERPHFVRQFQATVPRYFDRHREKAGMTGWAQVNGLRGNTSIEERTAYDLWYVENWTLWLDIKILLRTIGVVFKGENAC